MTDVSEMRRHGFCTVAQLRTAIARLQPDAWIIVNDIGNLSVARDDPDQDCDCGKPHFAITGYIGLAPFDLAFSQPHADLHLYEDEAHD
jgi:hypothetical protein